MCMSYPIFTFLARHAILDALGLSAERKVPVAPSSHPLPSPPTPVYFAWRIADGVLTARPPPGPARRPAGARAAVDGAQPPFPPPPYRDPRPGALAQGLHRSTFDQTSTFPMKVPRGRAQGFIARAPVCEKCLNRAMVTRAPRPIDAGAHPHRRDWLHAHRRGPLLPRLGPRLHGLHDRPVPLPRAHVLVRAVRPLLA